MERVLYHPIEFYCEHMAVVETGDVETHVAREIDDIELRKRGLAHMGMFNSKPACSETG
jgi:hypothetical protein